MTEIVQTLPRPSSDSYADPPTGSLRCLPPRRRKGVRDPLALRPKPTQAPSPSSAPDLLPSCVRLTLAMPSLKETEAASGRSAVAQGSAIRCSEAQKNPPCIGGRRALRRLASLPGACLTRPT